MNTEELNALKERAYNTDVEHGFHEEERPDAYWLGLVMSEMGESINADQKGLHANVVRFVEDMELGNPFKESFEAHIKDSLEDELADVVIRLFDFAGLRGYELNIASIDHVFSRHRILEFWDYKLPGTLVRLIAMLADASNEDELQQYVVTVIYVLSECFKKITGRDYDLWWFVEQKMQYNELRPKLNGKKC
jgi:NTP pyrophosphatase (non-canonical NTP hydrolase)